MDGKRTLLASTAIGLLAVQPSHAADAPAVVRKAPTAISESYPWLGPYIGLSAGYVWGKTRALCVDCFGDVEPTKPKGVIGGAQVGYNWQTGSWVWGFEADFSGINAQDTRQFPGIDPGKSTDRLTSRYDWLGTVRARAGFASGSTLWYVTGGFAAAQVKHSYHHDFGEPDGTAFTTRHTRYGWTAGGGVEWALDRNWSVKAEYLYVRLKETKIDISSLQFIVPDDPPFALPLGDYIRFKNEFQTVRLGMNYRFPPP